jgi:penicillin-binding protein A
MQSNGAKAKTWALFMSIVLIFILISVFSSPGETSSVAGFSTARFSAVSFRALLGSKADPTVSKADLAEQLGQQIQRNAYPETIDLEIDGEQRRSNISYSLDLAAQARVQKMLNQYKPDYAAFVAIDARTGRIISIASRSEKLKNENLALRATFPAASIFKVVTAGAAIDLNKASAGTVVPFNGANHTLYKRNVAETKENRWTRHMTLREAFGHSVNVFFGKLGLFYVGPENLKLYAERFLFNQEIRADLPVQTGYARFSVEDPWSVVTAASGFTRDNTMSPLHGAMIAGAVANDGIMMEPYIVETVASEAGEVFYRAEPRKASVVVEPQTADELRELFRQTVKSGTSRRAFRQTVRRSKYDSVEFGGKTGSLTGTNPAGKNDWFVGYARFGEERIAVAALTVNEKKWRVKSSTLANLFLTQYLSDLKKRELASLDPIDDDSRPQMKADKPRPKPKKKKAKRPRPNT